jgi:hypothetical protein
METHYLDTEAHPEATEAHPGAIETCPGAMEALPGGWKLIMNKLHENPTVLLKISCYLLINSSWDNLSL